MRITESQLRKLIRKVLSEQKEPIPGDSPGPQQVHVFDFDDTLGVSLNPAGVMLFRNGQPAWQSSDDAKDWMSQNGISPDDVIDPGITKINRLDGYAVYLTSGGLAKAQSKIPKGKRGVVFQDTESNVMNADEGLLIDFSLSAGTNPDTVTPVKQTVDKMKLANMQGSDTIVMTARKSEGSLKNFEGEDVPVTNREDITKFLQGYGVTPKLGVTGVVGKNKGEKIKDLFFKNDNPPEEVHFYDDADFNTSDVENELAEKVPAEVFIYGPGHFDKGEASADRPNASYPAADEKDEMMERWLRLAGIIQE